MLFLEYFVPYLKSANQDLPSKWAPWCQVVYGLTSKSSYLARCLAALAVAPIWWTDRSALNWIQLNEMELHVWVLGLQHRLELGLSSTLDNPSHLILTQLFDKTVFLMKTIYTNKLRDCILVIPQAALMICFVSEPIILTGINCCQQILLSFLFVPGDLLCVEKSALSIYSLWNTC